MTISIQLIPIYKTVLKGVSYQPRKRLYGRETAWKNSKGSFLCTNSDIFHELKIDEETETVTDYIQFCVDNLVKTTTWKKDITMYTNNKPYITEV